jgi:hypothetical protein
LVFGEAALFIGFVLPGETAVLLGGVLAADHRLSLTALCVLVFIAAVTGDTVGYEIGGRSQPNALPRFLAFNAAGGLVWGVGFCLTGYELLDRATWKQQNIACRCSPARKFVAERAPASRPLDAPRGVGREGRRRWPARRWMVRRRGRSAAPGKLQDAAGFRPVLSDWAAG